MYVHDLARSTPLGYSESLSGRFVFLDALRGIAAVAVVLFHFNNVYASPFYHERFSAFVPASILIVWHHLDLGVEIFFVLSGFVIAHSIAGQRVDLRYAGNFILRRSIRLDPPYWLILFVTMAWPFLIFPTFMPADFFERFGGPRGLLVNMFYLPDLLGRPRMVAVAWTLCLEVQFYLVYLSILFAGHGLGLARPRLRSPVVTTLFISISLASIILWFRSGGTDNHFTGRWWMFAAGVALYVALRRQWCPWRVSSAIVALAIVGFVQREPLSITIATSSGAIYLAGSLGKLQTWFAARPLQYLGRISYSLYLVHWMAGLSTLAAVERFGDGSRVSLITGVALALVVSIIAADLLHRFVEGPTARLAHRLRPKRQVA